MTDPVFQKIKADAETMLIDLWRMLRHQAPLEEWQHPRATSLAEDAPLAAGKSGRAVDHSSGLCYFHLN